MLVFCEACKLHVQLKSTEDLFFICSFVPATSCPSRSCHWSHEEDGAVPAYLMKGCVHSPSSARLEWVCLSGCLHCPGCFPSLRVLPYVAQKSIHLLETMRLSGPILPSGFYARRESVCFEAGLKFTLSTNYTNRIFVKEYLVSQILMQVFFSLQD